MCALKGNFAWYELMTTDTAAAGAFYSSVVGWSPKDVGMPGMPYTTFNVGEVGIAGLMTLPPEACAMGAPPSWIGYIHVDDCDAYAAQVVEAGGAILKPATDVPGMLRFVVVADPQGAAFVLFTSNPEMQSPANRPVPPENGTVGWHELYAVDLEAAWSFYSTLFGWEKLSDMDMGPMGIYRIFGEGQKQSRCRTGDSTSTLTPPERPSSASRLAAGPSSTVRTRFQATRGSLPAPIPRVRFSPL